MKVSQAVTFWLNYHRANFSKNTIRAYEELLARFCQENGEKDLKELTSDEVLDFLNGITEGKKPQTRKTRFSHLTSFFNFTKNNIDQSFQNPCDSPIFKKMFRVKALAAWDILEKEIVDEIIFKTDRHSNLSTTERYLGKISYAEAKTGSTIYIPSCKPIRVRGMGFYPDDFRNILPNARISITSKSFESLSDPSFLLIAGTTHRSQN